MGDRLDLSLAMEVARRAVEVAGERALRRFRGELGTVSKHDGSPVTRADVEAEQAIVETIRERFPTHSILAEESGAQDGDPRARWIVDPLDGTRGFVRGGIAWGPLVALELDGEVVAGAAGLPARGELYWGARGLGSYRNGERLRMSGSASLADSTVCLGEMKALFASPHGPRVRTLVERAAVTRCPGDVAGFALLLSGGADAWLEAGVRAWDLAAAKILVEEAGGRFTDLSGGADALRHGEALASNGALHEVLVAALAAPAAHS